MFYQIISGVILPIFILVGLGVGLQRKFSFHLRSMSHLLTYVLLPAAVFKSIYLSNIELSLLAAIIFYLIAFSVVMMIVGNLSVRLLKLKREEGAIFKNSVALINSGNYGFPVSQLIFTANPIGVSIQILVLLFQNVLTFSYGLYNLMMAKGEPEAAKLSTSKGSPRAYKKSKDHREILRQFLTMPIIYAIIAGFLFNIFEWSIPRPIFAPLESLANAFMAIALIMLGAQLSQIRLTSMFNGKVYLSSVLRLLGGPLVSFALILLFKLDGVIAQSLLIASCFPTSRNSASLALEYNVAPEFAAQVVFFSTLISPFTVAIVIWFAQSYWMI